MERFYKYVRTLNRGVVITVGLWNGTKGEIQDFTPEWGYVNVKVTEGPNKGIVLALKPDECYPY